MRSSLPYVRGYIDVHGLVLLAGRMRDGALHTVGRLRSPAGAPPPPACPPATPPTKPSPGNRPNSPGNSTPPAAPPPPWQPTSTTSPAPCLRCVGDGCRCGPGRPVRLPSARTAPPSGSAGCEKPRAGRGWAEAPARPASSATDTSAPPTARTPKPGRSLVRGLGSRRGAPHPEGPRFTLLSPIPQRLSAERFESPCGQPSTRRSAPLAGTGPRGHRERYGHRCRATNVRISREMPIDTSGMLSSWMLAFMRSAL